MFARWRLALLLAFGVSSAMGAIVGRVVEDHTGNPLASAGVRVFKDGASGVLADLDTDSAGRFEAPGLPAGEYRIEVSKPSFVPATVRLTATGNESTLPLVTVRLVRRGAVTGLVLNHEGRPVSKASVFAIPKPAAGLPLRPLDLRASGTFAQTDERGRYRLYNLAPGEYAIAASIGASSLSVGMTGGSQTVSGLGSRVVFYPASAQIQYFKVSGGEEFRNIDFSIHPTVLGVVEGRLESPTSGGQFWLALTPIEQPCFAVAVTVAGSDGRFRFEGVPSGSYHLLASGPSRMRGGFGGYLEPQPLFARTRVEVAGQDITGISIGLDRGRTASFRLRPPSSAAKDSACPPTAQVTLSSLEDWAMHLEKSVDVNSAQVRTVEDLAPARYLLSIGKLGDNCYSRSAGILDLTGVSNPEPREIVLEPAGSIRGRLTGAGKPSEFTVVLVSPDPVSGAQPLQAVVPGSDGRFVFAGLRPGRYLIAAQTATRRWVPDLSGMFDLEIQGGTPTEMDLPAPPPERIP
ncbi:MAG: carboxypeptidase-like regulatory domain-containing protein [Acidobacteriales bacterium]|nr:carboxypeptidase-like regulatory domain-containing protein [Terriglobales bacterium]